MNIRPIKTAARYLAGWGTVILFVVLLTLIFSFLGTFFCAALAGMMVGSVKIPRWQSLTLSLTFPVVLCTILRTGGAELLTGQLVLLSVLCLGTYWLTYLVVRAVVWYERKAQATCPAASIHPGTARNAVNSDRMPASADATGHLSLELLQGHWSCAAAQGNSDQKRKLMEINQTKLLLTVSDATGKVAFFGQGEISLANHRPVGLLTVSRPKPETDDSLVCI